MVVGGDLVGGGNDDVVDSSRLDIMVLVAVVGLVGWVRRVVETIWNVGAGNPISNPVRNANSGKPLKAD